ncbi:MAG: hypothetical protein HY217_13600 [Candidatus Rokubacteria bacterium]|nr:hypothetical protein [Candidatus Rokubacteria bacterium]
MATNTSVPRLEASGVAHAVRNPRRASEVSETDAALVPFRGVLTGVILGALVWLSGIVLLLHLR